MASADSKFDNLSDADTDSRIDDAIPKNSTKATAWGISVLKSKVAKFKLFIQASCIEISRSLFVNSCR